MQRAGMKSWVAVLYACAIVAVAAAAHAQGTAASIQGLIVDAGGPLPGATIVAKDTQSGFVFETVFNSTNFGCYNGEIPALPATNPNFGVPSCTVDNTSRRLQLGVRYAF